MTVGSSGMKRRPRQAAALTAAAAAVVALALLAAAVSPVRTVAGEFPSYAVCYSENPDCEALAKFSLVVLDPGTNADVAALKAKGVKVIAYLSVGEINSATEPFERMSKRGALLGENPDWPGSYYVNIASAAWSREVLDNAIPRIVKKGFDGLFLDTLGSPLALAEKNLSSLENPEETVYRFLRRIRSKFPDLYIIANNFEDHSDVAAPCVDAFNVESVVLTYNFAEKKYEPARDDSVSVRIEKLNGIAARYGLDVFVVDYAPEASAEVALAAYERLKKLGFTPFISAVELDRVYGFMAAKAVSERSARKIEDDRESGRLKQMQKLIDFRKTLVTKFEEEKKKIKEEEEKEREKYNRKKEKEK